MIYHLEATNTGPVDADIDFGSRLNILTGDNGLGKSFLLDIVWWSMTRNWPADINGRLSAGRKALPSSPDKEASIGFSFDTKSKRLTDKIKFDKITQTWYQKPGRPASPGLVLYAMADGSFAVYDPYRNYWNKDAGGNPIIRPPAYIFDTSEIWNGLEDEKKNRLCNGLIADWTNWQNANNESIGHLKSVLAVLSSPQEKIVPGIPRRISLDDVRDIPTIKMPYGEIPVLYASSGIRRILSLAYLLVWTWQEHKEAAKLRGQEPENRITFLIDEIEAHLHPAWQLLILPRNRPFYTKIPPCR